MTRPPTRLVIVRHGNTFEAGEPSRRIGAATDLPLVASGRAQAQALGRAFRARGWRFDTVLTGTVRRARETAAILLAELDDAPAPTLADWLTEIDHGPDEDQPEEAVRRRVGEAALAAWDADATPPPGWRVDAPARLAGWRSLFAAPCGSVLAVTSNGAARFALLAAGLTRDAGVKLRTGAWGELAIGDDGVTLSAWDERP